MRATGHQGISAVLPPATALIPVGGISPDNMAGFVAAGATGFGIGSALFRPGKSVAEVRSSAREFVEAYRVSGKR